MTKHKYIKQGVILGIVSFFFSACSLTQATLPPKYTLTNDQLQKSQFSLKKGKNISLSSLVTETEKYPVIFVGDHHNTEETHKLFNRYLQALAKKGYRIHLANEWFTPEHNKLLKQYTDGKISSEELRKKRGWDTFTSMRWDLVASLYKTVKDSSGRLYGVNISKEERKKISLQQINLMNKDEKKFYDELDIDVSAHKDLIIPYFDHCNKMPKKSHEPCKERMYRVQVSWDTFMAKESLKIAKNEVKTNKDKLIVFAGALHMEYGLGIPLRFSRENNLPFYIISNHKRSSDAIDVQKADAVFIY